MSNHKSFMQSIFNGHISLEMIKPYPLFTTPRESEFKLIQDSIESWLKEKVNSIELDANKKIPDELLKDMKDLGLFGLIIPEDHGGVGLTQTMYTRMLELINTHDSSVAITAGAHSSIGLKGLYLFGNPEQKKKYMPKLATGEMIASFALTEPTAGSDAAAIKTRAVKDGDYYVINGSKLWITNGGFASFFTVFAKESINGEDKITAFIVTRDMGGLTHGHEEKKLGIKASSTVEIYLKDVRVPKENILGNPGDGFKIAMSILNQGRIGLAGGAIGVMKSVFTDSLKYANTRKTFGQPIGTYEVIQNILSRMAKNIYSAEAITYLTTSFVDTSHSPTDPTTIDYSIEAAISKVFSSEAAWENINLAMQLHGGNGYMQEYQIERKLRDARISLIFEGTNEILRLYIALTGLKEKASEYKKIDKEIKDIHAPTSMDEVTNLLSKIGLISEFVFKEIKTSVFSENINGFDPKLKEYAESYAETAKVISSTASNLIRTYGAKLMNHQMQTYRLADMAIQSYLMGAVLSRIQTRFEKNGGFEKNQSEYIMAIAIMQDAKTKFHAAVEAIKDNHENDQENIKLSQECLAKEHYPFSMA